MVDFLVSLLRMNKLVIFYKKSDGIIIDFAILKVNVLGLPGYKQKKNQICKKHKIEKNCVRGYGATA